MCTEQNVTVGVPESEGRRSRPRTMSSTMLQVPLLVELSLKASTVGSGSKGVLVEQRKRKRKCENVCVHGWLNVDDSLFRDSSDLSQRESVG